MLKISKLAALAILGVTFSSAASAENAPAAIVNGTLVPQERIDFRIKAITAKGQPDSPELRTAVREDIINIELMSQEALKKGLDRQPETLQQLELARQTVLVGAFMQDYVKTHPISEEAFADEYNKLKTSLGNKEYKVRHILVEKEEAARSIAAKLKKGFSFDRLAAINSKDTGTKDHGGDLGWIPVGSIPNTFVKPFGDTLLKLNRGQVGEPVQSQFGWHVIKLEDVRDLKMPTLEEYKPQIIQHLQQLAVKDIIEELRRNGKIEQPHAEGP